MHAPQKRECHYLQCFTLMLDQEQRAGTALIPGATGFLIHNGGPSIPKHHCPLNQFGRSAERPQGELLPLADNDFDSETSPMNNLLICADNIPFELFEAGPFGMPASSRA
jgi:hypothetical protein